MDSFLSPRELADILGVSESSLKRWIDAGRIPASRTSGKHRRISRADAIEFVRSTGVPLAHPELLDPSFAPRLTSRLATSLGAAHSAPSPVTSLVDEPAFRALTSGDAPALHRWADDVRAAGSTLAELCDGPLRLAMHAIGALWLHDADGVFIEHRATQLCVQLLAGLRAQLPPSPAAAPVALGGAPENDPYVIPSAMAALVLADVGYETVNLGADCPTAALHRAIAHYRPRVVWISASTPLALPQAHEVAAFLASLPPSITAIAGGRASQVLAGANPNIHVVDSMAGLLRAVSA